MIKQLKMIILIAILVSISTALIGPMTFLGLLLANITREIFKTYKHTYLISGSMLIGMITLIIGQFLYNMYLSLIQL